MLRIVYLCFMFEWYSGRQQAQIHIQGTHIEQYRQSIADEIEPKEVSDRLFEEGVLNDAEHTDICEKRGRRHQAHCLLFKLEKKSQDELDVFLNIIEECGSLILGMLEPKVIPKKGEGYIYKTMHTL